MSTGNWEQWKKWNQTVDDNSAVIAMQFIKELCAAYQSELEEARTAYETEKKRLYNNDHDRLTTISNDENATIERLTQDNAAALSEIDQAEKSTYEQYHDDFELYLNSLTSSKGFIGWLEKHAKKAGSSQSRSIEEIKREELQARNALKSALDAQRKAQTELFEEQVRQANAAAEQNRSEETSRYNQELDALLDDHKKKLSEIFSRFLSILNDIAGDDETEHYRKTVLSSIPDASDFTCTNTIPDCIYFGDVSLNIARKAEIYPEVSQLITQGVKGIITPNTPGNIVTQMPYCQKLDDGISLFVTYSSGDRAAYLEQLKCMLLKIFMAFPAGKVEATMIDPLELGETFSMFTKLGEEQPRIIDTKVWSQEKDISECINILRQKLETMTQAYGGDKKTRLKKEPIRVLAITDFPTGFSQNALRDLQAIVRKSASYGVCIFIWANSVEMEKLQASQQSIFNEIKQELHVATAQGDMLMLETALYPEVRLNLNTSAELMTYSGNIINELAKGIHASHKKIEKFVDMFDDIEDPNNWFGENTIDELAIPIGIKGANTIVKMVVGRTDGSTAHHALIAGTVGAGKSTLLHTIIMSTLLNYSPDEAQMYLVDFKEGVEFKTYSKLNLPSIRVVAIDCEREFGLNILKGLQREMKRRYDLFKREADREEISEYRKVRGVKIPKLLVIFDEIQELFRGASEDSISKECEILLGELLTLGRAAGIHIILASQNFNLMPSLKPVLFSNAAIRIAIKGSEESAKSVLGDENPGAKQLQDGAAGAAVFNDGSGKESANVIFQVGYLDKDLRADFLSKLSGIQNSEAFRGKWPPTRVLLTDAEDDIFNVFNQLILNKTVSKLDEDSTFYCLTIGDGFELKRKFKIGIAPRLGSNILVIGDDEKKAASIFYFSILSLLYDELGNDDVRKDNQLINLIDLSNEEKYIEPDNTSFAHLETMFPKQVKRVGIREMDDLIDNTYDSLVRRMDGEEEATERLFLMFFGISRAHKLSGGSMYEDNDTGEKTSLSKLNDIIRFGAKYGINTIVWGESLSTSSEYLPENINRCFFQRIAFSTDSSTLKELVKEHNGDALRPTTAIYMDIENDVINTHFRPYDIPVKVWVEKIAAAYRDFE